MLPRCFYTWPLCLESFCISKTPIDRNSHFLFFTNLVACFWIHLFISFINYFIEILKIHKIKK